MPHPSFTVAPSPPGTGAAGPRAFATQDGASPYFPERNFTVAGVTRDGSGAALAGCTVKLFNAATDLLTQTAVSDASGAYAFVVDKTQTWYCVAYHAGTPDNAGTTVNTLAGA